ncbi:MAG: phosphoglucomutase/phosphomannomutase family protein [Candidatus Tantalella remota]|nr:phosphoglucomutase/phosphomannomutase family protein [Candidatus Tantalella remota]
MGKIKFGTDGWRAIISEDFTFENVAIVAQAVADFVKAQRKPIYKKRKLVIGYDTRFLSDKYAEIMATTFAANGIKVVLSDNPSPTPAVCVYIRDKKFSGGIMVTASHNPPSYNGIKYKGYFAGSAGSDIIDDIERRLYKTKVKNMDLSDALKKKMVVVKDIVQVQLDDVKKYANLKAFKKARLKVLVDSMYGTGEKHLEEILKDTSIKLDFMHADRNPGFNGQAPEPNEKHLGELMRRVKKEGYDMGVATDGDADRLAVVDDKGRTLTGHKLMALLLYHLYKNRGLRGGVVQTICGTGLIDKMCEKYGLPTHETSVGFKYICELMTKEDILIGGEETGGIAFKGYVPERDGFLSALLIMELILKEEKSLSQISADISKEFGNFEYERDDSLFDGKRRKELISALKKRPLKEILGKKVVEIKDYDGAKFICEDGSWLLLRLSGTEPKVRIYSETPTKQRSLKYIEKGKKYMVSLMKK